MMAVKLKLNMTFSMNENLDICVMLTNENGNEIACRELSFEQILDRSFEHITNPDERRRMIEKIWNSMRLFQGSLAARTIEIGDGNGTKTL